MVSYLAYKIELFGFDISIIAITEKYKTKAKPIDVQIAICFLKLLLILFAIASPSGSPFSTKFLFNALLNCWKGSCATVTVVCWNDWTNNILKKIPKIKILLFVVLFNILIIEAFQQSKVTVAQDPFQQFNNALKRNLAENESDIVNEMNERLRKQIILWTSVGLAFVLYFSVMAIIDMPNPKSSILYAKYDTMKGGNEF